ncbi:hypothetical protein C8J56DRAFT_900076 [Mycena floridula]|nr:hypothetical protein C8J56DRAFT_900076 [Mycena floridula]
MALHLMLSPSLLFGGVTCWLFLYREFAEPGLIDGGRRFASPLERMSAFLQVPPRIRGCLFICASGIQGGPWNWTSKLPYRCPDGDYGGKLVTEKDGGANGKESVTTIDCLPQIAGRKNKRHSSWAVKQMKNKYTKAWYLREITKGCLARTWVQGTERINTNRQAASTKTRRNATLSQLKARFN